MLTDLPWVLKEVLGRAQHAAYERGAEATTAEDVLGAVYDLYGTPGGEVRVWLEKIRDQSEATAAVGPDPGLLEHPALNPETRHAVANAWRFSILAGTAAPTLGHLVLGLLWEEMSTAAQAAARDGISFSDALVVVTGWHAAPPGFEPVPAALDYIV